ncbi:MAG: tRNA lysidine(34) synthetase TilS [Clostridia bacterium]|nr:tRNA lysidine(34) synthetase TilS [Clostridia bacterium]
MEVLKQRILNTINKYSMIPEGSTVVAAVSGGYDSLCMLHVLCSLRRLRKFEVCAAHVNHSFREEADGDEMFVLSEAERLGIKAYAVKYDVENYANENKISFETAGRILRYKFFEEVSLNYEKSLIATAHNANDSAESMLMHLMRGCGLTGLIGIRPVSGKIIRPLIETDRSEIENYCKNHNLVPREDCTNASDEYSRNDVRHNILAPLLERCSIETLVRTMNILADDDKFLNEYSMSMSYRYIKKRNNINTIPVKEFNLLPTSIKRRILRIALGETGGEKQIGLFHIDEILNMASKNHGGKYIELPGGRIVKLEKGELII